VAKTKETVEPADTDFTDFTDPLDQIDEEESKVSAPPATEAPKPSHPDTLVRRARILGIDDATIKKLDSDQLDDLVFREHRKLTLQEAQDMRAARGEEREIKRDPAPEPEEDEDFEADELEQIDPVVLKAMRRQQAKLKELKELKKEIAQSKEREQIRQTRSNEEAYDMAFESLGAKYEKIFGKGDGRELDHTSKEMKRRLAVLRDAGLDLDLDGPTTIKRKLIKAAEGLYGDFAVEPKAETVEPSPYDEVEKPVEKNGHPTKKEWEQAALAKPTQRRAKPPTSEAAAREAVREYYRAHGITTGEESEQLEGVPD
jgi:hypothetical protein